eukprot:11131773-Lingulodinium_polyedra.AAC.1
MVAAMSACLADFPEVMGNGGTNEGTHLGGPCWPQGLEEFVCTRNSAPSLAFLATFLRGAT